MLENLRVGKTVPQANSGGLGQARWRATLGPGWWMRVSVTLALWAVVQLPAQTRAQAQHQGRFEVRPVVGEFASQPLPTMLAGQVAIQPAEVTPRQLGGLAAPWTSPFVTGSGYASGLVGLMLSADLSVAASAEAARRAELERALQEARSQRPSAVLPLVLLSTGVAVSLVGVVMGLASVLPCDGTCSAPPLTGFVAAGGLAFATAGAVWLHWVREFQTDADRQVVFLEDQLTSGGP